MFVVRGTKRFRERVQAPCGGSADEVSTVLGDWYATVLFWKPQVALFVDERTLLPVLIPFAPAATVIARFPAVLKATLGAHGVAARFVVGEVAQMSEHRLEVTRNRNVIGTMNEFSYLASAYAHQDLSVDLLELSLRLAGTPCGPLRGRHGFPDLELKALVAEELRASP